CRSGVVVVADPGDVLEQLGGLRVREPGAQELGLLGASLLLVAVEQALHHVAQPLGLAQDLGLVAPQPGGVGLLALGRDPAGDQAEQNRAHHASEHRHFPRIDRVRACTSRWLSRSARVVEITSWKSFHSSSFASRPSNTSTILPCSSCAVRSRPSSCALSPRAPASCWLHPGASFSAISPAATAIPRTRPRNLPSGPMRPLSRCAARSR